MEFKTNGEVKSVIQDTSGNIFVGGVFTQAGDVSLNSVAYFDNFGTWYDVSSSYFGGTTVNAICADTSNNVYIFSNSPTHKGMKYNATTKTLSSLDICENHVPQNAVYANGYIYATYDGSFNQIMKYNTVGNSYTMINTDTSVNIYTSVVDTSNNVYFGGSRNGSVYFSKYNGTTLTDISMNISSANYTIIYSMSYYTSQSYPKGLIYLYGTTTTNPTDIQGYLYDINANTVSAKGTEDKNNNQLQCFIDSLQLTYSPSNDSSGNGNICYIQGSGVNLNYIVMNNKINGFYQLNDTNLVIAYGSMTTVYSNTTPYSVGNLSVIYSSTTQSQINITNYLGSRFAKIPSNLEINKNNTLTIDIEENFEPYDYVYDASGNSTYITNIFNSSYNYTLDASYNISDLDVSINITKSGTNTLSITGLQSGTFPIILTLTENNTTVGFSNNLSNTYTIYITVKNFPEFITNGRVNYIIQTLIPAEDSEPSGFFVAGDFTQVGDYLDVNNIAYYNDLGSWETLDNVQMTPNSYITAMTVDYYNSILYICGNFTITSHSLSNNVAGWDFVNKKWINIFSNGFPSASSIAHDITNNFVYVCDASHVAYWDVPNEKQYDVSLNPNWRFNQLLWDSTGIYACGYNTIGNSGLVLKKSGNTFNTVTTTQSNILSIYKNDKNIYIGQAASNKIKNYDTSSSLLSDVSGTYPQTGSFKAMSFADDSIYTIQNKKLYRHYITTGSINELIDISHNTQAIYSNLIAIREGCIFGGDFTLYGSYQLGNLGIVNFPNTSHPVVKYTGPHFKSMVSSLTIKNNITHTINLDLSFTSWDISYNSSGSGTELINVLTDEDISNNYVILSTSSDASLVDCSYDLGILTITPNPNKIGSANIIIAIGKYNGIDTYLYTSYLIPINIITSSQIYKTNTGQSIQVNTSVFDNDGNMYIGGGFTKVGDTSANYIACYTKNGLWKAYPDLSGTLVNTISYNPNHNILYVGSNSKLYQLDLNESIPIWNIIDNVGIQNTCYDISNDILYYSTGNGLKKYQNGNITQITPPSAIIVGIYLDPASNDASNNLFLYGYSVQSQVNYPKLYKYIDNSWNEYIFDISATFVRTMIYNPTENVYYIAMDSLNKIYILDNGILTASSKTFGFYSGCSSFSLDISNQILYAGFIHGNGMYSLELSNPLANWIQISSINQYLGLSSINKIVGFNDNLYYYGYFNQMSSTDASNIGNLAIYYPNSTNGIKNSLYTGARFYSSNNIYIQPDVSSTRIYINDFFEPYAYLYDGSYNPSEIIYNIFDGNYPQYELTGEVLQGDVIIDISYNHPNSFIDIASTTKSTSYIKLTLTDTSYNIYFDYVIPIYTLPTNNCLTTNGRVNAIVHDSLGNMYVGGDFTRVGDINANKIAKFNINGYWEPFLNEPNGNIYAMVIDNSDNIYVGGNFTSIPYIENDANYIARFSVSENKWYAIETGVNYPVIRLIYDASNNRVFSMETNNTTNSQIHLYDISDDTLQKISLSGYETYSYKTMVLDSSNNLYIGGRWGFQSTDDALFWIWGGGASWGDLDQYTYLGQRLISNMSCMNNKIYLNSNNDRNIFAYDISNTTFSTISNAFDASQSVYTSYVLNDTIYYGGMITEHGRFPKYTDVSGIQNTTTDGISGGYIYSNFDYYKGNLYFGGTFTNTGNYQLSNIGIYKIATNDIDIYNGPKLLKTNNIRMNKTNTYTINIDDIFEPYDVIFDNTGVPVFYDGILNQANYNFDASSGNPSAYTANVNIPRNMRLLRTTENTLDLVPSGQTGDFDLLLDIGEDDTSMNTQYILNVNISTLPCLLGDAMILTPSGFVNIKELKDEDYIITEDSRIVKIKNIYTTVVKSSKRTNPYFVKKHSISSKHKYPPENIILSATHLIKFKNKWICPQEQFKQIKYGETITYYHIELPNYTTDNLIINGGAVVESMISKKDNYIRDKQEWINRYRNKFIISSKRIILKKI